MEKTQSEATQSQVNQSVSPKPGWLTPWLRYAYFLRFSLLLWAFPVILIGLRNGLASIVSGLIVPEYLRGYLCATFFIVSTGYAALITARVVLINGAERWGEDPPSGLSGLLTHPGPVREFLAVLISQVPALWLLIYLSGHAAKEGVNPADVVKGEIFGTILGFVFWYLINAWYYLAFRPKDDTHAARTILFPRWFFGLGPVKEVSLGENKGKALVRTSTAASIETAKPHSKLLGSFFNIAARLLNHTPGFGAGTGNEAYLYEGQVFTFVAMFGFIGLYLLIWPLSAPVPMVALSEVALALALLALLFLIYDLSRISFGPKWFAGLHWKLLLAVGALGFWSIIRWFWRDSSAERFPILALILIMVLALGWVLAGLGFILDRYRVPVLSIFLVNLLVFHSGKDARDEHYFSTVPPAEGVTVDQIPTPAQVLDDRLTRLGADQPFIIVTATGGGLHASAWTAEVLANLVEDVPHFQDRLLMLSTVSGGSVGLNAYLHAVADGSVNSHQGRENMQAAAQCSAIEAVGWGLTYYDLPKAMIPWGNRFFPWSNGVNDLIASPGFKDRTWALREAFIRNQGNLYCRGLWNRDLPQAASAGFAQSTEAADEGLAGRFPSVIARNEQDFQAVQAKETAFSLTRMPPLPRSGASLVFPAFSMNTTSIENGDRFLLSNYIVPRYALDQDLGDDNLPAQAFLDTFRNGKAPGDLPLATAAQLSATFPYVSSTARAPVEVSANSVHFGDGGYYDNDGTATALEFMRYALAPAVGPNVPATEAVHLSHVHQLLAGKKLRIVWIEIRNSKEVPREPLPSPGGEGASGGAWHQATQLVAPLMGFWKAGHESVTGRNRAAMELFEKAFRTVEGGQSQAAATVEVDRVILTDKRTFDVDKTDPLNWYLTPAQRVEVRQSASKQAFGAYYQCVTDRMLAPNPLPCDPAGSVPVSVASSAPASGK